MTSEPSSPTIDITDNSPKNSNSPNSASDKLSSKQLTKVDSSDLLDTSKAYQRLPTASQRSTNDIDDETEDPYAPLDEYSKDKKKNDYANFYSK